MVIESQTIRQMAETLQGVLEDAECQAENERLTKPLRNYYQGKADGIAVAVRELIGMVQDDDGN